MPHTSASLASERESKLQTKLWRCVCVCADKHACIIEYDIDSSSSIGSFGIGRLIK